MPTCSQCEVNEAKYQVDNTTMCGGCLALTERSHNVRPLKRSGAARVKLSVLQSFKRRVAAKEFDAPIMPAPVFQPVAPPSIFNPVKKLFGRFFQKRGRG